MSHPCANRAVITEVDMEFLSMMEYPAVRLWLAQSTVVFFIVAGIALLVVGISLIVNSAGSLRLFGGLNRWVSMRRASRPLEIPRDTRQAVQNYRYWFLAGFIIVWAVLRGGLLGRFQMR